MNTRSNSLQNHPFAINQSTATLFTNALVLTILSTHLHSKVDLIIGIQFTCQNVYNYNTPALRLPLIFYKAQARSSQ